MHKRESVLESEIHKLLWDFEIQMDRLIFASRANLMIINKKIKINKKKQNVETELSCSGLQQGESERKKKERKVHIPCWRTVTRWWAFVVWVCVDATQRILLSVLARIQHKGPAREISHVTRRGNEGPRVSRQETSVKKWTVSRSGQQRPVDRTGQSRHENRAERRPVNKSQKDSCKDLLTYRCRVDLREKMSALLTALWEFSLEHTLALAHGNTDCTKSVA